MVYEALRNLKGTYVSKGSGNRHQRVQAAHPYLDLTPAFWSE